MKREKFLKFIPFLVLILLAGVLIFSYFYQPALSPENSENPQASNVTTDQNSQNSQQQPVLQHAAPVRLLIPKINVSATVIKVGLAKDGSVDVPKGPYDVAWFKLGTIPGEKGSAVITGHYGPWLSGAQSVFNNLNKLEKGDKIYIIDEKGKQTAFTVRESKSYDPDQVAPEVFNKDDGKYLNLITCSGDWLKSQKTFTQRLVVFTEAI